MAMKIGFVGTGVMGQHMAKHCLQKVPETTLSVFNRTKAKADGLLALGAKWCDSPKEVAKECDIVFSIVGYPKDVREVAMGENGILNGLREGGIFVDMTTSEPSLAKEIFAFGETKKISCIDAPVSGGDVGAQNGTLSIMVGGEKDAIDTVMPYFEAMGKNINHMGPAGSGQHTKMTNQILIASGMIGVCEGLVYAYKSGLDMEQAIRAVEAGAAGSWSISNLGPRILKRDFDPGFFVEHFVKDMGIALDEAKRMNLCLPGLSLAHQLYLSVMAQGNARDGTQALMKAIEAMNSVECPKYDL